MCLDTSVGERRSFCAISLTRRGSPDASSVRMAQRSGAPMAFTSASIGGCGMFSELDRGLIVAVIKKIPFDGQSTVSANDTTNIGRNATAYYRKIKDAHGKYMESRSNVMITNRK